MNVKRIIRLQVPLHPFLITIYMVIELYSVNITEVPISMIWRPLGVLLVFTFLFYFLIYRFTKNWQITGLILSLLLVLFFLYGRVYSLAKNITIGGLFIFRHRVLLAVWILLGLGGTYFIWKRGKRLVTGTRLVNSLAILLLAFPIISISVFTIKQNFYASQLSAREDLIKPVGGQANPDIYYIILDSYTRQDILQDVFDLDTTEFTSGLEDLGFYVAQCSQSNYGHTSLSLTSSLNMEYIQTLLRGVPEKDFKYWLRPNFRHSQIRTYLEKRGYITIAFYSGYQWGEWDDADYYFPVDSPPQAQSCPIIRIVPFEELLIDTTLARVISDVNPTWKGQLEDQFNSTCQNLSRIWARLSGGPENSSYVPQPAANFSFGASHQLHRENVLSVLETLPNVPKIPGPKFVFVHLISPHPPFVFGPNGENIDLEIGVDMDDPNVREEVYRVGYPGQIQYINRRMLEILPLIIENSSSPPIIIVQGDHGLIDYGNLEARMSILNAYYFPQGGDAELYSSISPVNSFRVIMNEYFNGNLPLLPDVSYYSPATANFDYQIVPNACVTND
jgi:hypothetical protein